jgi:hypothetical protein
MTRSDKELMDYADSRMMKYPNVLSSNDKFESEETTDWDKAFNLARHLLERGYPIPNVDEYSLATHILNKWNAEKEKTVDEEKTDNWQV